MSIILLSSLGGLFRSKRPALGGSSSGYSNLNTSSDGRRGQPGGRGDVDEENRLIDQLDEEWDG